MREEAKKFAAIDNDHERDNRGDGSVPVECRHAGTVFKPYRQDGRCVCFSADRTYGPNGEARMCLDSHCPQTSKYRRSY